MADDLEVLDQPIDEVIDTPSEVVAPEFPLDKDALDFIEQSGGIEYLRETKDLHDTFIGKDGQFDAEAFAGKIQELSPERYKDLVWTIYERHKDILAEQRLAEVGVKVQDIRAAKEWIAQGRPIANELADSNLDPNDPKDAAILESRRQIAEMKRQQDEFSANQERVKQERYQAYVAQEVGAFEQDRVKIIEESVGKLSLGNDELGIRAGEAIKVLAEAYFSKDKQASNAFRTAINHLQRGEKALAAKLYPGIDLKISHHTAQAAKFIGELLQAKRDTQGANVSSTQVRRPEISPAAAATRPASALSETTRKRGEFSPLNEGIAKIQALKAAGKL